MRKTYETAELNLHLLDCWHRCEFINLWQMTAEENNGVESRKRERQTAEGQPVKEDGRVLIKRVKIFYTTANHLVVRLIAARASSPCSDRVILLPGFRLVSKESTFWFVLSDSLPNGNSSILRDSFQLGI